MKIHDTIIFGTYGSGMTIDLSYIAAKLTSQGYKVLYIAGDDQLEHLAKLLRYFGVAENNIKLLQLSYDKSKEVFSSGHEVFKLSYGFDYVLIDRPNMTVEQIELLPIEEYTFIVTYQLSVNYWKLSIEDQFNLLQSEFSWKFRNFDRLIAMHETGTDEFRLYEQDKVIESIRYNHNELFG